MMKLFPRMLLIAVVCLCGCQDRAAERTVNPPVNDHSSTQGHEENPTQETTPPQTTKQTRPSANRSGVAMNLLPAAIRAGKLEFRVGEGEEVFSFKPKDDDACKFYNAAGEELCKMTLTAGVLKVKSADDRPLFELKPKDQKIMIKDASGENELFKFKLKGDTIDFYLPGDKRVHRIKKQDYGWRLEDNSDKTLFRAKTKDDKVVLRDLADKTVLYSKDFSNPLALVFFRMEDLSLEQQAACCVYFMEK